MSNRHIIHITNSFDKLKSILNGKSLRLKYCEEIFYLGKERISSAAHPMICFSEYDLNDLSTKEITYGEYGIAFSNSWVRKNKIHRVIYIDCDSAIATSLAKLLRARQNKETSNLPDNLRLPIMTIKCFTKNATGYNSYFGIHDFNFRNENEWRYVPSKEYIGHNLISQNRGTYVQDKGKHNKRLLPFPLPFALTDVIGIFVKSKTEIQTLINLYSLDSNKVMTASWAYKHPKKRANA